MIVKNKHTVFQVLGADVEGHCGEFQKGRFLGQIRMEALQNQSS